MKDNLLKGEEEVKKVKSAIAQTELNFLSKKNQNKVMECKMMNNQGLSDNLTACRVCFHVTFTK